MPTSCLTGCVASLCYKSTKRKVGDGPRRDHAAVGSADRQKCARDVEAVLSSDSYPFFLDPCTAICQITGHRNCGGWEDWFYHQRLYPYAFLLPERSTGLYSKESPEEAPAPLKPWFAILAPSLKSTTSPLVTGHRWKARYAGRYLRDGYRLLLGWYITCLRWEDKQYFVQPSNRHKD